MTFIVYWDTFLPNFCLQHPSKKYASREIEFSVAGLLIIFVGFILPALSSAQSREFSNKDLDIKIGQAIFEKLWVLAPSSTKSSDGLGPLYNARSCLQCHDVTKTIKNNILPSLVIQLSIEPTQHNYSTDSHKQQLQENGFILEPTYGKQLQTFAYPGAKSEASIEAKPFNTLINFNDGDSLTLGKYDYQITDLGYGKLHQDTKLSARVAPRMKGLGLLDQIPDIAIEALADPEDIDKDGISGKVNKVWSPESQSYEVGRFGWKATKASLNQQNLAALSNDIGISSWLFPKPEGDCTARQTECVNLAKTSETHLSKLAQTVNKLPPEASKTMTDLLLAFTSNIGKAPAIKSSASTQNNDHKRGQALFEKIGCAACHQASFDVTETGENGILRTQQITPYTDLLLHDMGEELSDDRQEFDASGKEWRTAPLWGIHTYLKQARSPHFLHDGRASSVLEAILWHGGEAKLSQEAFINLSKHQRNALIEFVESL